MEQRMSAVEVQAYFDEVLAYVAETQQAVIVECNGVDQAVTMSFEAYEAMRTQAAACNQRDSTTP